MNANSPVDPVPSARTKCLAVLPLFAQALVACRLAHRAALAMLGVDDQRLALDACDAIESIAKRGGGWRDDRPAQSLLASVRRTRENEAALEALRWAFDAVGAAQCAVDFPLDSTVTTSSQRCIKAVCDDPRISSLQVMILVESDIDQIAFACNEVKTNTYDGVSDHVLDRLAPCHALTLVEPRRNIEEYQQGKRQAHGYRSGDVSFQVREGNRTIGLEFRTWISR